MKKAENVKIHISSIDIDKKDEALYIMFEEKIISLQEIVKKTILSSCRYKLMNVLGANELNICGQSLETIFTTLQSMVISIQKREKLDENTYIQKLQDITNDLSTIFKLYGTETIQDLIQICFGSEFISKNFTNKQDNLHDLRNLLSKMCCLKQDLMAPQQTITAVKELGFATHMDIQPVADLTARCFSKTIPERDLSIQFIKWRDFGIDMIRRLCTAANLSESEVKHAEGLFKKCWSDVQDVAMTTCISTVGEGAFKQSPHEASPHIPEDIQDLRPYDGLY